MCTSLAGAEIAKDHSKDLILNFHVTNQGSDTQPTVLRRPVSYVVGIRIYESNVLRAFYDLPVKDVEAGTHKDVSYAIPYEEWRTWKDGAYRVFVDLMTEDLSATHDTISTSFSICSYSFGQLEVGSSSVVLLSDAFLLSVGADQGDLNTHDKQCDVVGKFAGNVRIYDNGWDWSFGFDAWAIDTSAGEKSDNTGKTELEFKVQVESSDGTVLFSFDDCAWTTSDTDGDGFYGDYSGRGGAVPCIKAPSIRAGTPPAELRFKVKARYKIALLQWSEGAPVYIGAVHTRP
jgi:hypothetical protein